MGDLLFNNMLMEHQMKVVNNLDFRCVVGLRNDLDYRILREETDPAVYVIGITSSVIPSCWAEAVEQANNMQLIFHKVGISNISPDPTYHDYKNGENKPATIKSSLFSRLQKYAHPSQESEYLLLSEHLGMGDTAVALINCVKEFTEENRGQIAHDYEQSVLGMIVNNFGYHPAGNRREGPNNRHLQENSLSNLKRRDVLEEKKSGVGTLAQFF